MFARVSASALGPCRSTRVLPTRLGVGVRRAFAAGLLASSHGAVVAALPAFTPHSAALQSGQRPRHGVQNAFCLYWGVSFDQLNLVFCEPEQRALGAGSGRWALGGKHKRVKEIFGEVNEGGDACKSRVSTRRALRFWVWSGSSASSGGTGGCATPGPRAPLLRSFRRTSTRCEALHRLKNGRKWQILRLVVDGLFVGLVPGPASTGQQAACARAP